MGIKRMEHVGIVVEDMEAAIEFFVALGLELCGEAEVEGEWVGRVIGLDGVVHSDIAMLRDPEGRAEIELSRFRSPPSESGDPGAPSNARGIRHISFLVDDLEAVVAGLRERGTELVGEIENYRDIYLDCYVRGPEGILVELAQKL